MSRFNPLRRAEVVRSRMMRSKKRYLVAKITSSVQETNVPHKILNDYFRYKDYMDNEEWFSASLDEVWSLRFLGLVENFWSVPIKEVKKLEFQNPPYSAAYRLGGDPRDYSKVFTIQVAGCDFDCNFCYVPKPINIGDSALGRFFTAKEIIDYFLSAKEGSGTPMKVVRISGGNPTLIPEIIVDVYHEIKKRNLDAYVWIDTNLSSPKYLEDLKGDLKNILNQKNVGVVGCFKGTCEEDFALLTGAAPEFYQKQFETAGWFLNYGTDLYIYLPALVYGSGIKEKLRRFIERLQKLDKNLPLRTEVLEIIDYPGAKLNFERAEKLGRPLPKTDQRSVLNVWYNDLLPQFYSHEDLERYCCEIPLQVHK